MEEIKKNQIGKTNLHVTELGMGTAPIGGWPVEVNAEKAQKTLESAWNKGIRYFDTAPLYGYGMAEERLGNFLKNKNRNEYVIASKIGRLIISSKTGGDQFKGAPKGRVPKFDFSYDGTMKSFEMTLKRTGLDKIDVIHLHDPDNHPDHYNQALNGAIKAMIKLKDEKVVSALGCGMNQNEMLVDLANLDCFDCFLLAGRYTLLDQSSLEKLIPICEKKEISLILGGVFNSGILIDPSPTTFFDYTLLDDNWYENAINNKVRMPEKFESNEYWLNKAYRLRDQCTKFNIPLKKAAIRFPYSNKVVSTIVLGMSSAEEVEENVKFYNSKVSSEFWLKLKNQNLIDNRVS